MNKPKELIGTNPGIDVNALEELTILIEQLKTIPVVPRSAMVEGDDLGPEPVKEPVKDRRAVKLPPESKS